MARRRNAKQPSSATKSAESGAAAQDARNDAIVVAAVAVNNSAPTDAVPVQVVAALQTDDETDGLDKTMPEFAPRRNLSVQFADSRKPAESDDSKTTEEGHNGSMKNEEEDEPVVVVAVVPIATDSTAATKPRVRSTKPQAKNPHSGNRRRHRSAPAQMATSNTIPNFHIGNENDWLPLKYPWLVTYMPAMPNTTTRFANLNGKFHRSRCHIGWTRILLFSMLIYEYINHLPHFTALDVAHPASYDPFDATYDFSDESMFLDTGSDTWLANDWTEWTQHWLLPRLPYAGKVTEETSEADDNQPVIDRDELDQSLILRIQYQIWYGGGIFWGVLALWTGGIHAVFFGSRHKKQPRRQRKATPKLRSANKMMLEQFWELIRHYVHTISATIFLMMYGIKMFSLVHLYTDYHYLLLCMGFVATYLDRRDVDGQHEWNWSIKHKQQPHVLYTGLVSWIWNIVIMKKGDNDSHVATNQSASSKHLMRRKQRSINASQSSSIASLPDEFQHLISPRFQSWTFVTLFLLRFQLATVFTVNTIVHRYRDPDFKRGYHFRLRYVMRNLRKMYDHYIDDQFKEKEKYELFIADQKPGEEYLEEGSLGKADDEFINDNNSVFPLYPCTIPNIYESADNYVRIKFNTDEAWRYLHHHPLATPYVPSISPDIPHRLLFLSRQGLYHKHGVHHPLEVRHSTHVQYARDDEHTAWVCMCLAQFLAVRMWLGSRGRSPFARALPKLFAVSKIPLYVWTMNMAFATALGWYYFAMTSYWDEEAGVPIYQITSIMFGLGFWIWKSCGIEMESSLLWWMLESAYIIIIDPFRNRSIQFDEEKNNNQQQSDRSNGASRYSESDKEQIQKLYKSMKSRQRRYAVVACAWILFQIAMPLRTIVSSKPFDIQLESSPPANVWTGINERYAWTQWFRWTRSSLITHTGSIVQEIEQLPQSCFNTAQRTCPEPTVNSKLNGKRQLHHRTLHLRLGYLVGVCRGHGVMKQSDYMITPPINEEIDLDDGTVLKNQFWKDVDVKAFPTNQMLTEEQWEAMEKYPRHWARLASGIARALETSCSGYQLDVYNYTSYEDAWVYGVLFQQLNGRGPYSRILDPTVDLEQMDQARRKIQSNAWKSWSGANDWFRWLVWDQMPNKYESILRGIGTFREFAFSTGVESGLWKDYMNAKAIYLIADRAECLRKVPLFLWPNDYPITLSLIRIPDEYEMYVQGQRRQKGFTSFPDDAGDGQNDDDEPLTEFQTYFDQNMGLLSERIPLIPYNDRRIVATSLEVGIRLKGSAHDDDDDDAKETSSHNKCGETMFEDVLWAIIFES